MKRTLYYLLLMILPSISYAQQSETMRLNDNWQFSESGKNKWKNAVVPGSVQRDLIRLNELPDPYWSTNEKLVQWVEDKNWDYRKTFTVNAEQLAHDDALLSFEGLDTYADVFLNGSKILSADNMFIGYEISVKKLLKTGENSLYIRFYSPIQYMMPAHLTTGFDYPADNDHRIPRMSVYSRKAPYHFGWDWGIRMVQIGIWRPVSITFYNQVQIRDFWLQQIEINKDKANLNNHLEIYSLSKNPVKATLTIDYNPITFNSQHQRLQKEFTLTGGQNLINIPLQIDNPLLWMPVGWGKQTIYNFKATISIDGQKIAEKQVKTGLRTIELVREKDKDGRSFYFKVNGIPFFAKGANYIPGEIINTQQDKAYYDLLFENIEAANMNMIRVWGGGFYEDNYFYQLADEKGVLIWQDFMFGCTTYPHDPAFLNNVAKEAEYNIRRLRNNPSIALWCGNNEVSEALKYWGWESKYAPEIMKEFQIGYDMLFKQLLPKKLKELDPEKCYIHSSPDTANWGRSETLKLGDSHYWGVWYARQPFSIFNERLPRFMSEFGFQAFPEMKTIRSFAAPDQWALESETMLSHQKSSTGNDAIKEYMDRDYHTPKNFEDFVYVGLVMQGRGMSVGMRAHRRNRPFCMGTLYWQLNDSWPVVSWAGIDYYGNWKALHYHARDAFKPLTIDVFEEDGKIGFYTLSDKLNDENNLKMSIELIDFNGIVSNKSIRIITAKANSSEKIFELSSNEFLTPELRKNNCLVVRLSDAKNKPIAQEIHYFDIPKNLNLPETTINQDIKYNDGKYTITLTSKKLAKDVFIEIPIQGAIFSDNFFDLLPNEKKVVTINSPQLKKAAKTGITIRHLRQTY
ncbi:MAG: beta-mannosidase [Paludibacteraceae bacterium]